jgi:predicted protein tyrosine phosphatase
MTGTPARTTVPPFSKPCAMARVRVAMRPGRGTLLCRGRMVQVFGETELIAHIRAGGSCYDHLISIGNPPRLLGRANPGQRMPRELRARFPRYLRLSFFDVESVDQLGPMRPKRVPTARDIRRVIRFFESTRSRATGYTIHCWRGISRSAAIALGMLYLIHGSEGAAKDELRRIRPAAMPLKRIVGLFDDELGCNLTGVNDIIYAERLAEWKRELDLDGDMLLEELPPARE